MVLPVNLHTLSLTLLAMVIDLWLATLFLFLLARRLSPSQRQWCRQAVEYPVRIAERLLSHWRPGDLPAWAPWVMVIFAAWLLRQGLLSLLLAATK